MTAFTLDALRLDGKTALVTGASRGLGQAMAVALAQAGADIVSGGTTKSQPETQAAVVARGRRLEAVACDITDGINVPAYSASKGAVMQLTKALANEWAAHDVQVNAIAPMGAVVFLASSASRYVSGHVGRGWRIRRALRMSEPLQTKHENKREIPMTQASTPTHVDVPYTFSYGDVLLAGSENC